MEPDTIIVSIAVAIVLGMLWRLYDQQQKVLKLLGEHIATAEAHNIRITSLESRATVLEAETIHWNTIKRIELYLSSMSPDAANSLLVNAIRAEIKSREEK